MSNLIRGDKGRTALHLAPRTCTCIIALMSPATENLILLIYLGVILLSLPIAVVLTGTRRASFPPEETQLLPPPDDRPMWMTPEGPFPAPVSKLAPSYGMASPYAAPQTHIPILAPHALGGSMHNHWNRPDAWFAIVLMCLMAVLLGPLVSGPAAMDGVELDLTSALFIGQLIFHGAIVGIVLVYLRVFRKLDPWRAFGIGNKGFFLSLGLALMLIVLCTVALSVIVAALMPLMEQMAGGELKPQMIVEKSSAITDSTTRLWMLITLAVGAPLMEEIVFRGILFSVAARFTHPVYAAVSTGAFFAVIHNSLYALLPLTLLGTALAFAYHKTKTLAVPILMHSIFNGLQFAVLFYGPPALRH